VVSISVSFIKFPQIGFAHSHAGACVLRSHRRDGPKRSANVRSTASAGLFDTDALRTNCTGTGRARHTYEAIVPTGWPAVRPDDSPIAGMRRPRRLPVQRQAGFMTGRHRQ